MIKQRIIWLLFILNAFLILLVSEGFKIKYFKSFLKECRGICKKDSKYVDKDYVTIHKKAGDNLK